MPMRRPRRLVWFLFLRRGVGPVLDREEDSEEGSAEAATSL
jgi:hypothetical protein